MLANVSLSSHIAGVGTGEPVKRFGKRIETE
jgi:hypothetical protein